MAGYCSETAGAAVTKFYKVIGRVQPFVVLKFRARATEGVPSARANVHNWINIGRPLLLEKRVQKQQWAHNSHLKKLSQSILGRSFTSFVSSQKIILLFFQKIPTDRFKIISRAGGTSICKAVSPCIFYIGSKQIRMPSWF